MKLCMGCMNQMEDHLTTCPHCGFNETTLRQESYYLDPGTIIGGQYIVGRVLSYGGHTVSYLGMDAEADRKVIVKEYLPSDFSTRSEGEKEITIYSGDAQTQFEHGLTNFLNEANKIQALGEPEAIAKVYNCIAENDTGYVISEYVQGKTLKEILASGKRYSVSEATTFISKILKGLCKVHPMNIIHCDISPETIMVTDSGEIKLLDFGATRYVTTANSKSLAIILKQGYAPEEQYRSSGKRGPWTDVYALGAVMYRMITGIVPQEAVERALVDELKEPSKLGISIPNNIENALMNALNVYKEERTPSAEVFLRELNSQSVKRIKVAKRKNETGKFPLWAKGFVAALLCIVIMGGVYIAISGSKDNNKSLEKESLVMGDFIGGTEDDVTDWLEQRGYDIHVVTKYMYSKEKVGEIARQSVEAGELDSVQHEGIDIEGGIVSGELTIWVRTDEYVTFDDINNLGMNAYRLKQELELDDNKLTPLKNEKGNYWNITDIAFNGGEYKAKDIENGGSGEEECIKISDIDSISYCAKNFFYWEQMPELKGNIISDSTMGPVAERDENDTPHVVSQASLKGTSLVKDDYLTFEGGMQKGYICDQTIAKGDKFDESEDMEKLENGYLLYVIKDVFYVKVSSAQSYKSELEKGYGDGENKLKFKEVTLDNDDNNREVDYVKVTDADGNEVKYFTEEDIPELTVKIITREVTTQAPAPTRTPTPSPSPSPADPDF